MNLINVFTNRAPRMRDFVLDLIFPIECIGCKKEGAWLCQECFSKLNFNETQSCLYCKTSNNDGKFCPACQKNYYLDSLLIAGNYNEEVIAKLIKYLKYYFVKSVSEICGDYLTLFIKKCLHQINIFDNLEEIIVIPVPLHKKRLHWRGFNQSELLANEVAKNFNFKIKNKSLIRVKYKKPQAKLNEKQRIINIKNCFSWQDDKLNQANVLLIDDVATTGSTLNECAKVLKENGASKVTALVMAKG